MHRQSIIYDDYDLGFFKDYQFSYKPECLKTEVIIGLNHPCDYYDNGINSKDILEIFIWLEGGYYLNIIQSIPSELLRDIAWNAPDPIKHR